MADRSKIEWTDATWNPIRARFETINVDEPGTPRIGWHCEHVSEGCRLCYAENMNRRLGTLLPFKPGHRRDVEIFVDEKLLLAPLRWTRPRMIFVCSMTDLFGAFVPDAMIDRVFAVMALASKHTLQVLTKRPERMRAYLSDPMLPGRIARVVLDVAIADPKLLARDQWPVRSIGDIAAPDDVAVDLPLPNVWLGTSVEDQAAASLRIPDLLATPAARRFLSCEPLLAKVDLQRVDLAAVEAREQEPSGLCHVNGLTGLHVDSEGTVDGVLGSPDPRIDWVIAGGESGPRARPMHPDWVRSLRDQCAEDGVPFFFKQWGMFAPAAASLPVLASDDEGYEGPQIAWPDGTIGGGHERENGGPGTRLARLSKKLAGRLLDGATHDGMPA